ncbi:MAG TPA: translation initiation factor IF-2 N-terminal domain-containing protein, partial [Rubrobacter sp.]|nr:translation initiation factor IF-2 N-terminal domain-containing protein [Rubrobacter sp.]
MSKRVYEIAREQSLENKEVLQRLQEAGVDVKSHSSSVDDNVYERVFGEGGTPNGRTEAQEAEAQEARAEAEQSGHNATIAQAPAEETVSVPPSGRPQKKRRRVVIDASARTRGARPAAAPSAPREPERAPVEEEEPESSGSVRVEPGASVKDLGDALG